MYFECSADDEWFVASAPVEGSGQEGRQVQALRVSFRELQSASPCPSPRSSQSERGVQAQVQVNGAESKLFVSYIVNSKSMSESKFKSK